MIMYSIYINNQSSVAAYVRLSSEKMQYSDSYMQKLREDILDGKIKGWAKECPSFLAVGGFCFISPQGTLPFPVDNAVTSLYISVVCFDRTTGVLCNFPFDSKMYGCIPINVCSPGDPTIVLLPYNPKAVWLPAKSGDELPIDSAVKAGVGRNFQQYLYFGRMDHNDGSVIPRAVTSFGKYGKWMVGTYEGEKGDLLKNTGLELIRARRGDPVPPNAVMTGVIPTVGSLLVGRVGGNIPCYITTEDGKLQCFIYGVRRQSSLSRTEKLWC